MDHELHHLMYDDTSLVEMLDQQTLEEIDEFFENSDHKFEKSLNTGYDFWTVTRGIDTSLPFY